MDENEQITVVLSYEQLLAIQTISRMVTTNDNENILSGIKKNHEKLFQSIDDKMQLSFEAHAMNKLIGGSENG